jgi:hypothetical protein
MSIRKKQIYNKQLPFGKKCENAVIKFMEKNHNTTLLEQRDDNKYDFKMNTKKGILTYEVKGDKHCIPDEIREGKRIRGYDSGNLFIEFEQSGKPSGIEVTLADWYVYVYYYLGVMYCIKTDKLRQLIKDNDFVVKTVNDEETPNRGYLIPREQYKEHFIIYNIR